MKKYAWLSGVIVWSVISAAFIGPGTVTTAVMAGSRFSFDLLWAVVFSTIACIVLQEMAARITIASGKNLGQTIAVRFGKKYGRLLQHITGGTVITGCAAYEAGNILGAVAGLRLLTGMTVPALALIITCGAFIMLWFGRSSLISSIMMILVTLMGIGFCIMAFSQPVSHADVAGSLIPSIPPGSELLVIGLIGTTIVPYNLFLGSGISHGQSLSVMRTGLIISVTLGGLVTAIILIAGTAVEKFSSFQALAASLREHGGSYGAGALALGLFAAGFSSAVTAPYAAAVIGETVFNIKDRRFTRALWIAVLLMGFLFGATQVQPVPIILAVQSLNGFILPLLVIVMILVVNDQRIIVPEHRPGFWYNVLLWFIVGVVIIIGINNIYKVIEQVM